MKVMSTVCTAIGASALAACSLLYNPNNLPAPIDVPVPPPDIDPAGLSLEAAGPGVLLEGQGDGGSRPAILAVMGRNIGPDATVALLPADGQSPAPMIEIDNAHAARAAGGAWLAVPVTLPIDASRGATGQSDVMLAVQITQTGPQGPVVQTLEGKVVLRNLPELDAPIIDSALLKPQYSRVKVAADLTFNANATPMRALIRAVASIELGDVHADASGQTQGPGGGGGGASGNTPGPGGGLGAGQPAVLLTSSASGGGYGQAGGEGAPVTGLTTPTPGGAMSGDDLITSYTVNGSGGGGGGGAVGGGGGGTLEITAGGTLIVGKVSANGASSSSNGGGGSGGAIVLRSGAAAVFGATTASGGSGGSSGGGAGAVGRLRYDVPEPFAVPSMQAASRRGVVFDTSAEINPLVTRTMHQPLRVVSATSSTEFKVFILDAAGTTTASTTVTFGTPAAVITPTLSLGYNRVCVTPPNSTPAVRESTNCIDIAYVP